MSARTFDYGPAVRATLPLILGVAGPTGSGKTFSALRLATGMQRVTGGDVALIDTEAKRATAYDRYFKFNHLDFAPPFGPIDYLQAIEYAISKGAKHIVIDSMTHEHSGPGGVMDQIETFLDKKCGNDYAARDRMNMVAHKGPKADRKMLNNFIIQAGRGGVNFILCYRADEKVKPIKGEGIQNMGMTPETTSKLVYEMMAMFLLSAAADGKPITNPQTPLERIFTKLPVQFRDMVAAGEPLSEDFGQKLAEWAKGATTAGDTTEKKAATTTTGTPNPNQALLDAIQKAINAATKKRPEGMDERAFKVSLMQKYFTLASWKSIEGLTAQSLEDGLFSMKAGEELL